MTFVFIVCCLTHTLSLFSSFSQALVDAIQLDGLGLGRALFSVCRDLGKTSYGQGNRHKLMQFDTLFAVENADRHAEFEITVTETTSENNSSTRPAKKVHTVLPPGYRQFIVGHVPHFRGAWKMNSSLNWVSRVGGMVASTPTVEPPLASASDMHAPFRM